MINLRTLLRCLQPPAAALAAMCLASCYAYNPAGYYGARTGTSSLDGDGKGTQRTEDYSPPPVTYAPARRVYVGAGYYPDYYAPYYPYSYGFGYWPHYYYSHGHYRGGHHYGGGHYQGGHGGSHHRGGGRH